MGKANFPKPQSGDSTVPSLDVKPNKYLEYLNPLKDPGNREDFDTFAAAYFQVMERIHTIPDDDLESDEVRELSRLFEEESVHTLIEISASLSNQNQETEANHYIEKELRFLHQVADLNLSLRGNTTRVDFHRVQEKIRKKAVEYVLNNFDVNGYLIKFFDLLASKLLPDEEDNNYKIRNDKYKNPMIMLRSFITSREFKEELLGYLSDQEKINIPFISTIQEGYFADKVVEIARATGSRQKVDFYANYARNFFLPFKFICADDFKLVDFLQEYYIQHQKEIKAALKKIEEKYKVNLYLDEESEQDTEK